MLSSARLPSSPTDVSPASAWIAASLPWLCAAILIACAAGVVGVWILVQRARELDRLGSRLDVLDALHVSLTKLISAREDLDLRRVEHVLIELRDGQKRLEDALLRAVEARRSLELTAGRSVAIGGAELAERVENRLLALGYERIVIVNGQAELDEIAEQGGEVLVEARRDGVPCKGKLVVRGGALTDVAMQAAYAAFP